MRSTSSAIRSHQNTQLDRDMVSVMWVLDNAESRRHRTQYSRPWRAQKGLNLVQGFFAAHHLSDMWG